MGLADIKLPVDPEDWEEQVHATTGKDPASFNISDIGGSASTIRYHDWLLLKVLWNVSNTDLTHKTIFGQETGARQESLSSQRLKKESDWWPASVSQQDEPLGWGTMFAWKQSVNDIEGCKGAIEAHEFSPDSIYDEIDPFRLVVEPIASRLRPKQETGGRHPQKPGAIARRDYRGYSSDSDSASERAPSVQGSASQAASHSSQEGSWSYPGSQDERGSLKGKARIGPPSSTGSGGLGSRLINRHRPDEALINMSLILLLQGITAILKKVDPQKKGYNWSILHRKFTVTQPGEPTTTGQPQERIPILTAKTDGCLQLRTSTGNPDDNTVLSIVEVKPYRRLTNRTTWNAIRIQEGAEMAAWISAESTKGNLSGAPDGVYRRVLISQDFDQVFITIAEFDDLYVRHITGDNTRWSTSRRPVDSPSRGRAAEAAGQSFSTPTFRTAAAHERGAGAAYTVGGDGRGILSKRGDTRVEEESEVWEGGAPGRRSEPGDSKGKEASKESGGSLWSRVSKRGDPKDKGDADGSHSFRSKLLRRPKDMGGQTPPASPTSPTAGPSKSAAHPPLATTESSRNPPPTDRTRPRRVPSSQTHAVPSSVSQAHDARHQGQSAISTSGQSHFTGRKQRDDKTPSPPRGEKEMKATGAPKREPGAARPAGNATGGFLVMREYRPFDLKRQDHQQRLFTLLLSLTDRLCTKHQALALDMQSTAKRQG